MKKIHFDIIYTFVILAVILYIGAIFGFYITNMMPGDPVLGALAAMGIHHPTVKQYNTMAQQLGFDLPLYLQFIRFFFDTAFGNWGFSISINAGEPVIQMMAERLPRTIDMLMLPLIIGLILGFLFGYLAAKHRNKGFRGVIRVLSVLGSALPIMLISMFFQHFISYGLSNLLGFQVLPAVGYKNMAYPNPPFVTGFRIIDSMLSGEWYLIPDYLWHLVLPWTVLVISFTSSTYST